MTPATKKFYTDLMELSGVGMDQGDEVVLFLSGGWQLRGTYCGVNEEGEWVFSTSIIPGASDAAEGRLHLVNPDRVVHIHLLDRVATRPGFEL